MKIQSYRAKNAGLIQSLDVQFPRSGLVYIKAKNESGKSTFLESLWRALTGQTAGDILTRGKKDGHVEMDVEKDGHVYTVRMDLDPTNGDNRFTILLPNGLVQKKVSDLRSLIGMNDITVEDIIDFGKTPDGQRKQVELVVSLLPDESRKSYEKLCSDEKESYAERESLNRQYAKKKATLDNQRLSAKEDGEAVAYLSHIEESKVVESKLSEYASITETISKVDEMNRWVTSQEALIESYREQVKSNLEQIKAFKEQIRILEEKNIEYTKLYEKVKAGIDEKLVEVKTLSESYKNFNRADYDSLLERKKALDVQILNERTSYDRSIAFASLQKEVDDLDVTRKNEDERLRKIRAAKRTITSASLPISNLLIEDGVLYYEKDGELFLFKEKSTASSKLIMKAYEIVRHINRNMDLVLISRGGELDEDMQKTLHEMAVKDDCLVLMEMVDAGDLRIEVYEEV